MKRFLQEPLVHFLALGTGLFLAYQFLADPAGRSEWQVTVTADRVAQLDAIFRRTWQRPPTEEELDGLIQEHVKEEILYREARAAGLDEDDLVIRRRLRQKIELLWAGLEELMEPTEKELQTYLSEHADDYAIPVELSFRQIYLNSDERGEASLSEAERLVQKLTHEGENARIDTLGDPFLLPQDYDAYPLTDVVRLFGQEFAEALSALPDKRWSGPIYSSYGVHVAVVLRREPGRLPGLDEARKQVRRDWLEDRRRQAEKNFYEGLRQRYTVVVEKPG
jgi:hypothetical protein